MTVDMAPLQVDRSRGDCVLSVRDLSVELPTEEGWVSILDRVSLDLESAKTLGVVGESGSGKTMTALSILGVVSRFGGRVTHGSIRCFGRELLDLSEHELRRIRGKEIGMIFQEPRRALDPAFKVGDQIAETVRLHMGTSRKAAWSRAVEMLDLVGIPFPAQRAHEYPHTFSGGMCQRVGIAIALATGPRILFADEPTTSLDVTVQAQVLDLLKDLQEEMGLAILFITHDLSVVAEVSDAVSVMYAGQVVEAGDSESIFRAPTHPYTAGLLAAMPDISRDAPRFEAIPGRVPPTTDMPPGCRFHPRCPHAIEACRAGDPDLRPSSRGSSSRCIRTHELDLAGVR